MDELQREDKHKHTGYTEYSFQPAIQEHLLRYRVFRKQRFQIGMCHLQRQGKYLQEGHRLFEH